MQQPSRVRAALVSTVRGAAPVLRSFIEHHRSLGFERLFLFFDDPADEGIAIARRFGPAVAIVPRDAALERAWRGCVLYPHFAPHVETEVMARQCLNAELAIRHARSEGIDWLLHLDADELLHLPVADARDHFARIDALGFSRIVYPNLEGIAETIDIGDWFREVTLFKVNRDLMPGRQLNAVQSSHARKFPASQFLFYSNGKSATRLGTHVLPDGVHRFMQDPRFRSAGPDAPREAVAGDAFILHYACCGYDNFRRKYEILGAFADRWFGRVDIRQSIGDFHPGARDVVNGGNDDAARAFYRRRAMIDDRDAIEAMIEAGMLRRITGPAARLDALLAATDGTAGGSPAAASTADGSADVAAPAAGAAGAGIAAGSSAGDNPRSAPPEQ